HCLQQRLMPVRLRRAAKQQGRQSGQFIHPGKDDQQRKPDGLVEQQASGEQVLADGEAKPVKRFLHRNSSLSQSQKMSKGSRTCSIGGGSGRKWFRGPAREGVQRGPGGPLHGSEIEGGDDDQNRSGESGFQEAFPSRGNGHIDVSSEGEN